MNQIRELDCRGLRCPLPIIKVAQELSAMSIGDEIVLASDDPATEPDLAAWARMRKQFAEPLGDAKFLIRKLA